MLSTEYDLLLADTSSNGDDGSSPMSSIRVKQHSIKHKAQTFIQYIKNYVL